MMKESMYTTLLSLPLFQGLSRDDITRIIESTRLDFRTLSDGGVICRQDAACDEVFIVIDGAVDSQTKAADGRWTTTEKLGGRDVIGLEVLYGRRRSYMSTCKASTTTRLLAVSKRTMGALFRYFEVMQINAFNMLTSNIATRDKLLWVPPHETLERRIVHFMHTRLNRPAGWKRFDISMAILGSYLGEDPRRISKALHKMQAEGLIRMTRRSIEIPAFERLLQRY